MSSQPLSALDHDQKRIAKGRDIDSLKAIDMTSQRHTNQNQGSERVVNIYADGRLAYTGLLSLAAIRLGISERALALSIERGLAIAQPREPRFYQTPDGRWPRARTYMAKWRDA